MIHGGTPVETCFAAPLSVSSNGNFQLVKAALCKNLTFHVIEVIMESVLARNPCFRDDQRQTTKWTLVNHNNSAGRGCVWGKRANNRKKGAHRLSHARTVVSSTSRAYDWSSKLKHLSSFVFFQSTNKAWIKNRTKWLWRFVVAVVSCQFAFLALKGLKKIPVYFDWNFPN